jgi:hypothetical protein
MSQPYEAVVAELREARSLLETIANSTEHADAAQKWECEKAELIGVLRRIVEITGYFLVGTSTHPTANSLLRSIVRISKEALAKYEAK